MEDDAGKAERRLRAALRETFAREARRRGWSLSELERRAGLSERVLADGAKRKRGPALLTIVKAAEALGLAVKVRLERRGGEDERRIERDGGGADPRGEEGEGNDAGGVGGGGRDRA